MAITRDFFGLGRRFGGYGQPATRRVGMNGDRWAGLQDPIISLASCDFAKSRINSSCKPPAKSATMRTPCRPELGHLRAAAPIQLGSSSENRRALISFCRLPNCKLRPRYASSSHNSRLGLQPHLVGGDRTTRQRCLGNRSLFSKDFSIPHNSGVSFHPT